MTKTKWRGKIALLVMVACVQIPLHASQEQQILEALRKFDAVYIENGFSVTGTATKPADKKARPGQPDVTRNWSMTIQGEKAANIYEVKDPIEGINFVKPGPNVDHDPDGNFLVGILTKRHVYCDSKRSGMFTEHTVHQISPENKLLDKGTYQKAMLSGPGFTGVGRFVKEILWSVGRGFSGYIEEITELEELEGGKLRIVARGRQSDVYNGFWHLVIDKESAWIVRQAKFFHENYPEKVDFESTNSGLIWNGPLAMPEQAAVNYSGPINEKTNAHTLKMAYTGITHGLDEELLKQVQTSTQPPFHKDADIMLDRPSGPIFLSGHNLQTMLDQSLESLDDVSLETAITAKGTASTASDESKVKDPNTLPAPPRKTEDQNRSLARSRYLLPRWAAYVVLILALLGIVVLVAKLHRKGEQKT